MKLIFSKPTVHDLVRLRDCIVQHNPEAVQRVAQRLEGIIQGLLETPQVGRNVDDMPAEIRELIFGRYVIRYVVGHQYLYILRIRHGKVDR